MSKPSQYHRNRRPYNFLIYDIIDKNIIDYKNKIHGVVYDLGCGEMPYKNYLLKHCNKYIGVDWGNTPHELRADLITDLNEKLPIPSGSADTVICLSVIEHLREPQVMLGEVYRILNPGGAILLQVPFMWWVHEAPYDFYRFTRYGLEHIFNKAGFKNVKIQSQGGYWVMSTLKLNYQLIRLIRGPWLIRKVVSFFLNVFWAIDQRIAPILDKHWSSENETVGYFVVAEKS